MTRFPDEMPFAPDAIIAHDKTLVRKSPAAGDVIATLPAGTDVLKLSNHNGDDLICFDDPADGGHKVGWVPQLALNDPSPPPAPAPVPDPTPTAEEDAQPPSPDPPQPSNPGGHHKRHQHGPPRKH